MKTHRASLTFCAALVLGAACDMNMPFSPGEQREWQRAKALWASRRPASYTYEVRVLCFCPAELVRWSEVDVRGDSVVAVRPLEGNAGPGSLMLAAWPTVEFLFRVPEQRAGDYLKDVTATYDEQLGYPRRIEVTCKPTLADCGTVYEARNLRTLTAARR